MNARISLGLVLSLLTASADAAPLKRFFAMTQDEVARTLKDIHRRNPILEDRIGAVSERFLDTPYRLGPLGEGPQGEFDRGPLVDFKAVDCTTFVEQAMALSLKADFKEALSTLRKIRYRDGKVSYETRNHFPETDWLPNNAAAGYIKDISRDVAGEKTGVVHKKISKREWYAGKALKDLEGFDGADPADLEARLSRLRGLGKDFEDQVSTVAFVPLDILPSVIDRIPSGTVMSIVRADLPDKPLVVTHQGLIVAKDGRRYVRHAASDKKVEDVPALEYFYRYFNSPWRVVGLNLSQLQP